MVSMNVLHVFLTLQGRNNSVMIDHDSTTMDRISGIWERDYNPRFQCCYFLFMLTSIRTKDKEHYCLLYRTVQCRGL